MSRSAWNFMVDSLLAIIVCTLLAVSAVIFYVFPKPSAATGWTVWGWTLDQWLRGQSAITILFAAMLLVHLILHWNWILGFITARWSRSTGRTVRISESAKTLFGVTALILVLAILASFILAAALASASPRVPDVTNPPMSATHALRP
jgi:hypothetical protein